MTRVLATCAIGGVFAVAMTAATLSAPPPIIPNQPLTLRTPPPSAQGEPAQFAGMLAAHNRARRAVGVILVATRSALADTSPACRRSSPEYFRS